MKLYNSTMSPSARRVRVFLAEKGLDPDTVNLDLQKDEARSPEYLEINSLGAVPALVLDDGAVITESVAVCRYLDALHPAPPLFGTDARAAARVEMWIRRLELEIMRPLADVAQHTIPFFATRLTQNPGYAAEQRESMAARWRWLDGALADRPWVAGDTFTMADIVGLSAYGVAQLMEVEPDRGLGHLWRWIDRVSARPSAAA